MTFPELRDRIVIRMLVSAENPKRNRIVGILFYPARTGDTHTVGVEEQFDHHPGMDRRLATRRVVIAVDDLGQVQGIDDITDEVGQMVLGQPVLQCGRQKQQLARLIVSEASLGTHAVFDSNSANLVVGVLRQTPRHKRIPDRGEDL